MRMKDELIGDRHATVQYVVHGDVPVVPVGLVCPLDAGYALGIGNAFMLSYHGVTNTYDLDLRVNLKTDSASIDVRSRANTEAQEEVTQQRNFGNYHATFNWDRAPKTITNRFSFNEESSSTDE